MQKALLLLLRTSLRWFGNFYINILRTYCSVTLKLATYVLFGNLTTGKFATKTLRTYCSITKHLQHKILTNQSTKTNNSKLTKSFPTRLPGFRRSPRLLGKLPFNSRTVVTGKPVQKPLLRTSLCCFGTFTYKHFMYVLFGHFTYVLFGNF